MYKLLDLFCGAGGCAMGYYQAGFEVWGCDIMPQPRFPFPDRFIQADFRDIDLSQFDVITASPPCQAYSRIRHFTKRDYPDLVPETRQLLIQSGKPYVIENVPESNLLDPLMLCGTQFDLMIIRHRLFESNIKLEPPVQPCFHKWPTAKMGTMPKRCCEYVSVVGHFVDVDYIRNMMGVPWMVRNEVSQAIPPAYTRFIGNQLLERMLLRDDESAIQSVSTQHLS